MVFFNMGKYNILSLKWKYDFNYKEIFEINYFKYLLYQYPYVSKLFNKLSFFFFNFIEDVWRIYLFLNDF